MAGKGKPFTKGNGGRPVGATNHLTRTVKETVLAAFEELQGDPKVNIVNWGRLNPTEFYKIAAKLIPTELTGSVDATIKQLVVEPASQKDKG
jgi:hypothetical protein